MIIIFIAWGYGKGNIPYTQLAILGASFLFWCFWRYDLISIAVPKIRIKHKTIFEASFTTGWLFLLFLFLALSCLELTELLGEYSASRMGIYLGVIGAVVTLTGILLSYLSSHGLDKKLDMRIKQLNADESFAKFAESLKENADGIGLPPVDLVTIINRNSFIPGFWTDPFLSREHGWQDFLRNLTEKVVSPTNSIRLDLLAPDFRVNSEQYIGILQQLAEWSVASISELGTNNGPKRQRIDTYLRCHTAFCSNDISSICGKYNTIAALPPSCSDCIHLQLCRNKEVLKRCALISYCDNVIFFLVNLKKEACHRLRMVLISPDTGFNYPLLVLFDSDLWRSQRSRAILIVMQQRAIETGEFVSHVMFPWEVVRGLRGTIPLEPLGPRSQNSPEEAQDIKDLLEDAITFHSDLRNLVEKELQPLLSPQMAPL